jgi:hypothetical protein
MQNSINYNQIIKDCFWDYSIDANYISEILNSDDLRRKQKLFSKIIYNSTDKARTLQTLFDKETLQQLFATFTVSYNKKYIDRYILVLKNILLGENNYIESLAWKKR